MSQNKFTTNNNPTLVAVSNADGETPVYLWADPTTHALLTSGSGGGGGGDGAILDGVNATIKATVFSLTNSKPLATQIVDGSGTAITSFGGGTQYAELTTTSPATGTLSLARYNSTLPTLTDGQMHGLQLDTRGGLQIVVTDRDGTSGAVVGSQGTNIVTNINGLQTRSTTYGQFDDVSPGTLTEDRLGIQRMSANRNAYTTIRDGAGNERGANVDVNGNLNAISIITDGTNTANTLKSDGTAAGWNSLMTAPGRSDAIAVSAVPTTTSIDLLPSTDVSGFSEISIQVTAYGTGTWRLEWSNDNTTFNTYNVALLSGSLPNTTFSSLGVFRAPRIARYLRIRASATGAGSTTGTVYMFTLPTLPATLGAAQTGTWTVGSNSATGSAVPANAFYGGINASGTLTGINSISSITDGVNGTGTIATGLVIYNGTNTDRVRSIINANNSTGTGILATGILAQFDDVSPTSITENQFGNLRMSANRNLYGTIRDAGGNERGVNVTANNSLQVVQQAATATLSNVASSATSVTLLASNTARIGGSIYNDSTQILYVKFGTTASNTSFNVALAAGAYFEINAGYTGRIDGIWVSANGNARVTEIT